MRRPIAAREPDADGDRTRTIREWHGFSYISHFPLDYVSKPCYIASHPRSSRGVSGDDPEGGAGSGVLRRRLVTAGPGRPGTPPARHYDLAARSSLHGSEGNCLPL